MPKYKEPEIYIINNYEIAKILEDEYTIVSNSNMGVGIFLYRKTDTGEKYFNLISYLIENLHEYKVVVIDLQNNNSMREYGSKEINSELLLKVDYPKQSINIKPFAVNLILSLMSKQSLRIIFADQTITEDYISVKNTQNLLFEKETKQTYNTYSKLNVSAENKQGKKIFPEKNRFAEVIQKYAIEYRCIFKLPEYYENNKKIIDENFIPVLLNYDKEVISFFAYNDNGGYDLVLPVCKDKPKLIKELFDDLIPEIIPNIFPESKNFSWLKDDEYKLSKVLELETKALELKEDYEKKLEEISKEKKEISVEFKYLNDLLTETGNLLVEAVRKYFMWLGFEKVELVDKKETGPLREDLQIFDGDVLFIVEVKGIGGTSTDAECSQIAKHRRRREKEYPNKTIYPLYIVNHQRYIRPELRKNPPFDVEQIDYALNDERGLLTTYQLYEQYKLIENGIFTKKEIRECLTKYGLIDFIPADLQFIGKVNEYFKRNKASILELENTEVNVGDIIWAYKDKWYKGKVESIQVDSNPCQTAYNGEVGIVLDIPIGKGYNLYKKKR